MQFNSASFESFAQIARAKPDKAALLCLGNDYSESTSKWFCLSDNMLFYFSKEGAKNPEGVVMLPGCEANIIEDDSVSPSFELTAGSWSMVLTAPSTEALLDWAVALSPLVKPDQERNVPAGVGQSSNLTLQRFSSVRGLEMATSTEPGAGQSKLLKAMKQAARAEAQNNDVSTSFDKLFDTEVGWRKRKLLEDAAAEKKGMQLDPSAKRFGYHAADLSDTARATGDNLVNNADFLKIDKKNMDSQILELLHDSPVFHKRLKGLDEFMGVLHSKFTKLEKSASVFVESDKAVAPLATNLCENLVGFTTTLRAFHDSGEDPDAGLDAWTSSWSTLLQEMQVLRTVLDTLLQSGFQDPLHEIFRNETKEARNAVKKFHAARAKYAQALQRYLAMGKDTDAKVMKTVETKLEALKNSVIEFARVAMARLLSVERRRKIECLERMNDFMYLHLSYFRHGYKLMQSYDEPMRQLRVAIQGAHRGIAEMNNEAVGKVS
jgi:hypothetical protein